MFPLSIFDGLAAGRKVEWCIHSNQTGIFFLHVMDDLPVCMEYGIRGDVIVIQRADAGAALRAAGKVNSNYFAILSFIGIHGLLSRTSGGFGDRHLISGDERPVG